MGATPVEEKQLSIFLSYSYKDKPFVDWLYRKLVSANLKVWYDKYEIHFGDTITDKIEEGLKGSDFLIVVLSQQGVKSNWVKTELEPKILRKIEEQKVTILPIVLDDIRPDEVPTILMDKKSLRFPREGSDKAFGELLKSIEGYLQRRSSIPAVQSAPQNLFGLRGGVEPDRFIIPELLIQVVTEDIIKKQSISIIGARMMGKTSLLKFLASPLCQVYYRDENGSTPELRFVYFDLQEHAGKSYNELIVELANTMSNSPNVKKRFRRSNASNYEEALKWIKSTTGRRGSGSPPWILLLDEFDLAVELSGTDKFPFDDLRSLAQHYNLCFVIASRLKLIDLPLQESAYTSPFLNIFKGHFLTVWDAATAHKLMFKPYGRELELFNENDFTFMSRLTAHHPLLLQIGCHHLFNAYRTSGKMIGEYDQLLDAYMQDTEDVYRYYWNYEINDIEREWLSDCSRVLSRRGQNAQEELQKLSSGQRNRTIRTKLAGLGLVLNEKGPLEIPTGFQTFLEQRYNVEL